MTDILRDLRTAVRTLARRPGFTLVAVLTLTLGIGATTAIFTVVRGVLLEPLPYPDPDRLVLIQEKNPEAGFPRFSISPLNFRDYRAMSTSFESMAAMTGGSLALIPDDGGPARRLRSRQVTADLFRVLGTAPVIGRDFSADDDLPGATKTMILGHHLWRDLGADPEMVGRTLRIDGDPTTVIGVLPAHVMSETEAFVPLAMDYEASNRGAHWLVAYGRMKPGVEISSARAELEDVASRLATQYPDSNTGWGAIVDPLHARVVEGVDRALWILLGAVALVLFIACANVANLTLARVATRSRELTLRGALGASRFQLVRQLLAESLVITGLGAALGLLVARWATKALVSMDGVDLPRSQTIGVDSGVLLFALLATVGTALLVGTLPALRASRIALAGDLADGGRGHAGTRHSAGLRRLLTAVEVALAVMILVGAGLLLRSFVGLLAVEPGFDPEPVWTASVSLPESRYEEEPTRVAFVRRLVESAAAMPGVASASTVMPMPLSGGDWVNTTYLEGEPIPEPNQEHHVNVRFIGPNYFQTVGIPILQGRPLGLEDHTDAEPAVVVNARAMHQFWSGRDPVGMRVSFGRPDDEDVVWYRVVGVAGDVHHTALDSAIGPAFYRSALQDSPDFMTIVVRAEDGDPAVLGASLRDVVRSLDPALPVFREQRARDMVTGSLAAPRFNTTLLGIFAGLALALSAIGVFGVVSYSVAQRFRELGVRLALGARSDQILTQVLLEGMRPVFLGALAGLAGALLSSRLLSSLVHGVSTADPATFAAATISLVTVAAFACLIPAARATRVDPVIVLREE